MGLVLELLTAMNKVLCKESVILLFAFLTDPVIRTAPVLKKEVRWKLYALES